MSTTDLTATDQLLDSGPWQDEEGVTGAYVTLADVLGVTTENGYDVEVWDSGTDRSGCSVVTVHSVCNETGKPMAARFYKEETV